MDDSEQERSFPKDDEVLNVDQSLEELAENVPGVLFQSVIRADGSGFRFQYISPRSLELVGVESNAILDDPMAVLKLMRKEDQVRFFEVQKRTAQFAESFSIEVLFKTETGRKAWAKIVARGVIIDDVWRQYHGVAIDISSHKSLIEQLENANSLLEQHGDIQNRQLKQSNEDLKRENADRIRAEGELLGEQKLLRRIIDLQDRERRLVAYDIHDGFVQDVVGAQLLFEGFRFKLADAGVDVEEELDMLRKTLQKAINEGRRLISELRPMVIDEMGIVEAIRYLIDEEESLGRLEIDFQHDIKFDRLESTLEGIAFRIIQESLSNIVRHSGAKNAAISLMQHDRKFVMEVVDHGKGFNVADVPKSRFGLEGIRERSRLYGGEAEISSTPGKGTRVRVELPIELPRD